MKQLISIRQAITEAIELTDEDNMKLFPSLVLWAIQAEKKIDSPYSYEEDIVVVAVDDYRAKLPIAPRRVVAIVDGDQSYLGKDAFFNQWRNRLRSPARMEPAGRSAVRAAASRATGTIS